MDLLSIAASLAGLLTLAAGVASTGYALCSKMSKGGDDVKALANEIATFSGVLLGVKMHLESQPTRLPDLNDMARMVTGCGDTLVEISQQLDAMTQAGPIAMMIKRSAYESRLKKLLEDVERHKSIFNLYLSLDNSAQAGAMQRRATEMTDSLHSLKLNQNQVGKSIEALTGVNRREKIIQWLGVATNSEHEDLSKRRDPTSAQWILDKPEYESWLSSPNSSFFWLNGPQGSGKSTAVSKIIETVQETNAVSSRSPLVYHYCSFSNPGSLSPSRLVGSLIGQLLKQASDPSPLMTRLDELYNKNQRKSTLPSFQDIQQTFLDISKHFDEVFLVLDGLDEMADRWDVLGFLENLSEGCRFKVLVASRAAMYLEDTVSSYCAVTITPADIALDIEHFVRRELGRRRFRGPDMEQVVHTLVTRADGMFLWAVCQVEHLSHVRSTITPSALKALPQSLERTFEQTFLRLNQDDLALARRILQFVMFSSSPLGTSELVEGIAVTSSTKSLADIQRGKLCRPNDVFEICGSLVRESQSTGNIELAHYSVYEFLKLPDIEGKPNSCCLGESEANRELLMACIRYLTMDDVSAAPLSTEVEDDRDADVSFDPEVIAETPFLQHAIDNWPIYMSRLSKKDLDDLWLSVLLPFFQPTSPHFDFWTKAARHIYGKDKYPSRMTPLHAAALYGLLDLTKLLLQHPALWEAPWRHMQIIGGPKTPLHIAIENGNDALINIFILPNYICSTTEMGLTPLHTAVEAGNAAVIMQLVTAKANVNFQAADGRTPIFIAIENCWEDLALLLAEMADADVTMPDGRGFLHLAAQTGSTVWMSHLLRFHPSHLNAVDEAGWTPLHYAVDRGYGGVAKILLSKGACVAIRDRKGWTPIHAAIQHKHFDCARVLLVSKNAKRPKFTPWIPHLDDSLTQRTLTVAKDGSSQFIGSSTSEPSGSPGPSSSSAGRSTMSPSPLYLAVSTNYTAGVDLLLQHAKTYGRSDIGVSETSGSCLTRALSSSEEILESLLPESNPESILAVLPRIAEERKDSVLAVLQRKFDSEFVHKTLLPEAFNFGDTLCGFLLDLWPPSELTLPKDILHTVALRDSRLGGRLIDGGADMSYKTFGGTTLMQAALQADSWDMIEQNLARGVELTSVRPSALHDFVTYYCRDKRPKTASNPSLVADAILRQGVDINSVDRYGETVCHRLAYYSDSNFLAWALQKGAHPAQQRNDGESAVHIATRWQRVRNLELLLDASIKIGADELMRIFAPIAGRRTPFQVAVDLADIDVLRTLVDADQKANKTLVEYASRHHWRTDIYTDALCSAIKTNFGDGVTLLAANSPNISASSTTGDTPLHTALRHKKINFVRILLEAGADANAPQRDPAETPLCLAAERDLEDATAELLKHGAQFAEHDLVAAAKAGVAPLLQALLAEFPDAVAEQRRALFTARRFRRKEAMEVLLARLSPGQHVVDGVERDVYGDSVLHQAVRTRDVEAVLKAVAGGGKALLLPAKDVGGDSALMLAIRNCQWGCAEVLVREDANVEEAIEWAERENCALWVEKLMTMREERSSQAAQEPPA